MGDRDDDLRSETSSSIKVPRHAKFAAYVREGSTRCFRNAQRHLLEYKEGQGEGEGDGRFECFVYDIDFVAAAAAIGSRSSAW